MNEVRERAADLERDIEALRKSRMRVRELFVIVRDSLTKRKASVARARDLDQKATTMRFHEYMSRKGHSAAMEVDDDQRALNLSVSMKGHEGTTEDLKSLSGGERSYTTVSWLLAVGHSTRSPFKAFDEYDVFQDATARRITTTCLLEYAADNPEVQILLLTPQDTSAINEAEHDLERFRGASLPDHFMTMLRMRAARENATYA